jgi:hypothetical protein
VRERKAAGPSPIPAPQAAPAFPPARSADAARSTLSSFMTGVGKGRRDLGEAEPTDDPAAPESDR